MTSARRLYDTCGEWANCILWYGGGWFSSCRSDCLIGAGTSARVVNNLEHIVCAQHHHNETDDNGGKAYENIVFVFAAQSKVNTAAAKRTTFALVRRVCVCDTEIAANPCVCVFFLIDQRSCSRVHGPFVTFGAHSRTCTAVETKTTATRSMPNRSKYGWCFSVCVRARMRVCRIGCKL